MEKFTKGDQVREVPAMAVSLSSSGTINHHVFTVTRVENDPNDGRTVKLWLDDIAEDVDPLHYETISKRVTV